MSSPVAQYLYFSRAVESVREDTVEEILAVSNRNNLEVGITGLLLFENFHFMQLLEGSESAVEETVARIRRDERHTNMITIFERSVSERQFAEWSMARFRFSPEEEKFEKKFLEFLGSFEDPGRSCSDEEAAIKYVRAFENILKTR